MIKKHLLSLIISGDFMVMFFFILCLISPFLSFLLYLKVNKMLNSIINYFKCFVADEETSNDDNNINIVLEEL